MHRTEVSPLAHAALAHAQFETIHPFPDGNGRTGRALIHSLLRRRNVTRSVTVPISAGLLVDTDAYFASLNAYRGGDPNDIVSQTSDAAFASVDNSRAMLSELDELSREWRSKVSVRADSSVWQLTELLFRAAGGQLDHRPRTPSRLQTDGPQLDRSTRRRRSVAEGQR